MFGPGLQEEMRTVAIAIYAGEFPSDTKGCPLLCLIFYLEKNC